MFGKKRIVDVFTNAIKSGSSPEKLALSVCIGFYIAFSPFPGIHTIFMFIARWLFGLNLPVLFLATSINNPWTVVPFYSFDYLFGYWLIHDVFGWNPGLVISLSKIFGIGDICLWSFLIGGNLLGLIAAFAFYPFIRIIFIRIMHKKRDESLYENNIE